MGCPNPVLPEPLVENVQVTSLLLNEERLAYKYRQSLFRALTLYLIVIARSMFIRLIYLQSSYKTLAIFRSFFRDKQL